MSSNQRIHSRRNFLLTSSAASLAALLPGTSRAQTAPSTSTHDRDPIVEIPSRDTVLKFNPDGSRRAFAGNTVICHLPQQCRTRDAIAALSDALRDSAFAHKLGVLPNDSYHMTVFSGPNDQGRTAENWPKGIRLEAPISECNTIVADRLANFRTNCELPLRVAISLPNTLAYGRACTLRLSPANADENIKLRALRDRLSDAYQLRAKDHATYAFHITVAYQMDHFTSQEQASYRRLLEQHVPAIIATAPVLQLGVPEFCTFEDMYRFEIHTLLRS